MLFALINGLGKSDQLAGPAHEMKASKVSCRPQNLLFGAFLTANAYAQLLFSSRILLVLIVNLAKLATMFLVQEIFTKGSTKWWLRTLILLTVCESFIGSLLISAGCSPGRILLSGDKSHCSGIVRYIKPHSRNR